MLDVRGIDTFYGQSHILFDVSLSLRLIDRAYIIDNGRIRFQGTAKELENNDEIRRMHLMI
jgi:branched-chain amino acid transport system ATP-binding protein